MVLVSAFSLMWARVVKFNSGMIVGVGINL